MRMRLPAELHQRAERLLNGDWQAPEAIPASTVILLQDNPLAAYLMRRVTTMAFAAGMHVFPGGRISDQDFDSAIPWWPASDHDDESEAHRVTADLPTARALIACAVRETFEETGVLLARGTDGDPVGYDEVPDDRWEPDRIAVLEERAPFADVLRRRGLSLDPTLLPAIGHWVTPEVETRRYDVRFYVAHLPARQRPIDVGGEADKVHWVTPAQALGDHAAGRLAMLPPTVAMLAGLQGFASADDVLASARARSIIPLLPRPVRDDGGVRWVVVDARDGSVAYEGDGSPPAGSEVAGINSRP